MAVLYYNSITGTARLHHDDGLTDLGVLPFSEASHRAWLANWVLVKDGDVVFGETPKRQGFLRRKLVQLVTGFPRQRR